MKGQKAIFLEKNTWLELKKIFLRLDPPLTRATPGASD